MRPPPSPYPHQPLGPRSLAKPRSSALKGVRPSVASRPLTPPKGGKGALARYRALAKSIRRHAVLMTHHGRAAHIGTTMSMAELLAVLYGGVMRVDPKRPDWPERDRFILSKGHGCAGVYAALAATGFFPVSWLEGFYVDGGRLTGHLTHTGVPGVEVSTGSLGHGLSIATGMALAAKRDGAAHRVFVMLSDGECDEGSTWEPALFAPHHKLDNLVVIVDYNKIQSLGHVKDVLDLEPLGKKWEAFGWAVTEIDGHDLAIIDKTLRVVPFVPGKPSCVIAHTVKGKGVSFMEDKLLWHYRNPSEDELKQALAELDADSSPSPSPLLPRGERERKR